MKSYFDRETMEYLKERGNSMVSGQQIHQNHANCPAGRDTKNRLYIKVSDDGKMVLGYCHHCGSKGAVRRHRFVSESVPKTIDNDNDGFMHELGRFSRAIPLNRATFEEFESAMLAKPLVGLLNNPHSITSVENTEVLKIFMEMNDYYSIRITEDVGHRIVMVPLISAENYVDGLLTRSMGSGGHWFCHKKKDVDGTYICGKISIYNTFKSDTVVICEDIISAIKLDISGYAGCALMGSQFDSADLLKLSMLFRRCVVWLDNDSALIKEKAHQIRGTAKMFFEDTDIITISDPKHYTTGLIKERLK